MALKVCCCLLSLVLLPSPTLLLHLQAEEYFVDSPEIIEDVYEFPAEHNPEINGDGFYEGDMLLTEEQRSLLLERKAIGSSSYRWPEGADGYPLVPYVYQDEYQREAIERALSHWMEHTCINFEETNKTDQPHLQFFYGGGCWSYVGRMSSWNGQQVSIGIGCEQLGIVVHEVGHAIGFYHEQSRPDRDSYIRINMENIYPNRAFNFNKHTDALNFSVPYDYSSNMHYGALYFSVNGKNSITTRDPRFEGIIGTRNGLSHRDKLLANSMYKCIDKWVKKCNLTSDPCQNLGYLGSDCQCVCEPGTEGDRCQNVTGGYYDKLVDPCTEKITEEGTVTSPNYPNRYPKGIRCVKWIVAPKCHVPKLTFNDFQLIRRFKLCNGTPCCYFDSLEIRTENIWVGTKYCGTEISRQANFTGAGQDLVLAFNTLTNFYKGFSAELTFIPVSGCQ